MFETTNNVEEKRENLRNVLERIENTNSGLLDVEQENELDPHFYDEIKDPQSLDSADHEGIISPVESQPDTQEFRTSAETNTTQYIGAVGVRLEYERDSFLFAGVPAVPASARQSDYDLAA